MDLATLEETNRLRESMGMKPLPVPGQAPAAKPEGEDDEDEDPLATLDGRHAAAYDNYKKAQEAELAKRRREEKAEAVKRAREKAQRHALLAGKTLGDLDFDDEGASSSKDGDARAWLRGQKKRQQKISQAEEQARRAAEEAAKAAGKGGDDDDDDDDRAGVKVGHEMAELLGGDADSDQILTLRDATVLENEDEGDELEHLGLRERERLQERLDLKKKRQAYDPLDDALNGDGGSRTILGHYDEEIYGKKRKHFTLDPNAILGLGGSASSSGGASGAAAAAAAAGAGLVAGSGSKQPADQQSVSIDDIVTGGPSSDYLDASEIKIKKPKKKSKTKKSTKATRQRGAGLDDDDVLFPAATEENGEVDGGAAEEDDRNGDDMDVDEGSAAAAELAAAAQRRKRKAMSDGDDLLEDEDHLQAALAVQRREALKKRKRMRPEDLAKQLRATSEQPNGDETADGDADDTPGEATGAGGGSGGLVIDETAEFISNLKRREDRDDEDEARRRRRKSRTRSVSVTAMGAEDDDSGNEDVAMKDDDDGDEGDEMYHLARDERERSASAHLGPGLEEEKRISAGMGATLSILRERGILHNAEKGKGKGKGAAAEDDEDASSAALNERLRRHQQFVAEKKVRLARLEEEARRKREQDRTSGPMARMSAREREEYARKQNVQREYQQSRMLQDMFNKSYTPSFRIEYVDEHGRELNQKEAFRALSHGFHGKQSGRGKTDKMLKKIEAEKRHMAEGILDASQNVGMSSATAQQLKKRKEAGVRLD